MTNEPMRFYFMAALDQWRISASQKRMGQRKLLTHSRQEAKKKGKEEEGREGGREGKEKEAELSPSVSSSSC